MPAQPSSNPIYVLSQKKSRALIPKILSMVILSVIFYIGILVNISLLDLTAKEETQIKLVSFIILVIINFIGIYVAFHRSAPYKFYAAAVFHHSKSMDYSFII